MLENFGEDARPRTAWQIDPFGHSSEMATIFALVGIEINMHTNSSHYADMGKSRTVCEYQDIFNLNFIDHHSCTLIHYVY